MTWATWELSADQQMVGVLHPSVCAHQAPNRTYHLNTTCQLNTTCLASWQFMLMEPNLSANTLGPPHPCTDSAALGLGAVHCINADSQRYRARKKRNSAGAEKWMDVRMWDTAASCINNAKASGYRVVATHFDPAAVSIHDVDWTQPTAILLGNEREGTASNQGDTNPFLLNQ